MVVTVRTHGNTRRQRQNESQTHEKGTLASHLHDKLLTWDGLARNAHVPMLAAGTSVPVECAIEERSANAVANVVIVSGDVKGKVSPIEFFTVSNRLFYRRLEIDLRVQPHVSRGLDGRRRQPWAVRHVIQRIQIQIAVRGRERRQVLPEIHLDRRLAVAEQVESDDHAG